MIPAGILQHREAESGIGTRAVSAAERLSCIQVPAAKVPHLPKGCAMLANPLVSPVPEKQPSQHHQLCGAMGAGWLGGDSARCLPTAFPPVSNSMSKVNYLFLEQLWFELRLAASVLL